LKGKEVGNKIATATLTVSLAFFFGWQRDRDLPHLEIWIKCLYKAESQLQKWIYSNVRRGWFWSKKQRRGKWKCS